MSNVQSGTGDAFDAADQQVVDETHELMAKGIAETVRLLGFDSADNIELLLESGMDEPERQIDIDRVRQRANEILEE